MDRSEGAKLKGRIADLFQARVGGKPLVANRRSVTIQGTARGRGPSGRGPLFFKTQDPHPSRGAASAFVKKALLQGVPSSADDGIKRNPVISGDMRLGNDTAHEVFDNNFARNRGKNFVQLFSKKWRSHFFESHKPHTLLRVRLVTFRYGLLPAGGEHPGGAGCTAPRPPVR